MSVICHPALLTTSDNKSVVMYNFVDSNLS
jgi:hypothetical protein